MGDHSRQGRVRPPEKGRDQAVLGAEPSEETLQWLGHRVPRASQPVSLFVAQQDRGIRRPSCSVRLGQALHSRGKANISARSDAMSDLLAYLARLRGRAGYYWQFLGCYSLPADRLADHPAASAWPGSQPQPEISAQLQNPRPKEALAGIKGQLPA